MRTRRRWPGRQPSPQLPLWWNCGCCEKREAGLIWCHCQKIGPAVCLWVIITVVVVEKGLKSTAFICIYFCNSFVSIFPFCQYNFPYSSWNDLRGGKVVESWIFFLFLGKHFGHAEIKAVSKRPAMNLRLPSFRGPDDVAVACLYLALRKRGRKKSTGRLSCFWGSFYFIFIPHVTRSATDPVNWQFREKKSQKKPGPNQIVWKQRYHF